MNESARQYFESRCNPGAHAPLHESGGSMQAVFYPAADGQYTLEILNLSDDEELQFTTGKRRMVKTLDDLIRGLQIARRQIP